MERIRHALAQAIAADIPAGEPIAIGLSGGRDSVVLLDALAAVAADRVLCAVHIHHGLSPHAGQWQAFCEALCAERGITLAVETVTVPRTPRTSLEGEARRVRYAALAAAAIRMQARFVALAHHRDDQAETLLLQLLRGAGPHGLAAMPAMRGDPRGVTWWRPLLDVARAEIDAYAASADLRYVDDESNAQTRHLRNAVRHVVMPVLATVAGNPSATLARAAAHQAEAVRLADDLAAIDAQVACDGTTLVREALASLPAHRARNLLRWFLRERGLPAPSAARLAAMVTQLGSARDDARVRLAHAGMEIGVHRGRVIVHAAPPPPFALAWQGEQALVLPHGTLELRRAEGCGIDARHVAAGHVTARSREGGERMQLAPDRPRRALKSILQDAGVPAWERQGVPLIYVGESLAAAVGIGIDSAYAAQPGHPGITLTFHPGESSAHLPTEARDSPPISL